MKKVLVLVSMMVSALILSGCAAVVQGGGALMAREAASKPAKKSFVVASAPNVAFTAATRALAGKERKITSSDREAGVLQAEWDGSSVTIAVARKSAKESTVDIMVAYTAAYVLGDPQLDAKAEMIKAEIERIVGEQVVAEVMPATSAEGKPAVVADAASSAATTAPTAAAVPASATVPVKTVAKGKRSAKAKP